MRAQKPPGLARLIGTAKLYLEADEAAPGVLGVRVEATGLVEELQSPFRVIPFNQIGELRERVDLSHDQRVALVEDPFLADPRTDLATAQSSGAC
nr:hypothetical protein [Microtetraspora malaysiensis]